MYVHAYLYSCTGVYKYMDEPMNVYNYTSYINANTILPIALCMYIQSIRAQKNSAHTDDKYIRAYRSY